MYGDDDRKIGVFCGLGSRLTGKTGSGDERLVGTYLYARICFETTTNKIIAVTRNMSELLDSVGKPSGFRFQVDRNK